MTGDLGGHLVTAANPNSRHDYLVLLGADLPAGARLAVRYVPDRLLLAPGSFSAFAAALAAARWPAPEAMALAVLDVLNNEVVPRWVQVRLSMAETHEVVAEDRQPHWDNPALLDRLAKI